MGPHILVKQQIVNWKKRKGEYFNFPFTCLVIFIRSIHSLFVLFHRVRIKFYTYFLTVESLQNDQYFENVLRMAFMNCNLPDPALTVNSDFILINPFF